MSQILSIEISGIDGYTTFGKLVPFSPRITFGRHFALVVRREDIMGFYLPNLPELYAKVLCAEILIADDPFKETDIRDTTNLTRLGFQIFPKATRYILENRPILAFKCGGGLSQNEPQMDEFFALQEGTRVIHTFSTGFQVQISLRKTTKARTTWGVPFWNWEVVAECLPTEQTFPQVLTHGVKNEK